MYLMLMSTGREAVVLKGEPQVGLTREQRLFFLGAGSIGEAMLKGMVSAQLLPPQQITVCNRAHPARLQALERHYGVHICQDKQAEIAQADILLLAVKPFDLVAALQEIAPMVSPRQLIVSVVAGASTRVIEQCLLQYPHTDLKKKETPGTAPTRSDTSHFSGTLPKRSSGFAPGAAVPVIRAMPNTSSFVQASATALCRGRQATAAHVEIASDLFSAIGTSEVVDEAHMDAVTGLSGTGPAYFYYVAEALLEAGRACGLAGETCRALLVQTMYGAAKMLQETGTEPAELRHQVTSPNGTTMAAMAVLEQGEAQQLFLQAVQRATMRASEMGQQLDASVCVTATQERSDSK